MFKICPVSLQPKRPRFGSRKLLGSLAGAGIVPAAVVFALSIASGRSIGATAATFQALASNPSNLVGALYVLPPGQNAATSQPNGVVHLSWNASLTISPDPISYLVFRRPAATGSYTQIGSAAAGVLTYNDTPSTDGQYDYIIQAQVSTFTSLNSNTETGSTANTLSSDKRASTS